MRYLTFILVITLIVLSNASPTLNHDNKKLSLHQEKDTILLADYPNHNNKRNLPLDLLLGRLTGGTSALPSGDDEGLTGITNEMLGDTVKTDLTNNLAENDTGLL